MADAAARPAACAVPMHGSAVRSRGKIGLSFHHGNGRTALHDSYQAGCLRVRSPRRHDGVEMQAVLINTSGGLAEGDCLDQHIRWGAGSAAVVATQAAEKVYRAQHAGATVATRIGVEAGARAEWLPQETILFDRARLRRDTQACVAPDASLLAVEAIVLGRTAMDEQMREGLLSDRWRIWRDGRLVYADALRLEGPVDALMQRAAIGAGARAMAVMIHVSSRAAELLTRVREAFVALGGRASASAWNGLLVIRLLAGEGAALRHDMLLILAVLRDGRPMPRVWSC